MKCANCPDTIEYYAVVGNSGFWVHPDKVDYGDHGTSCNNEDETDAEPTIGHYKGATQ